MADPTEIVNPRKALKRREEEAEEGKKAAAPAPAPAASTPRFTREYSPEDRERQKRGLAEALKKRGY